MLKGEHYNDRHGNPAGGGTRGVGIRIDWQNGPLHRGEERLEPNGAFVEQVIEAAIDRLEYYQKSQFACGYNVDAIAHLESALRSLNDRTADREIREVEGTHEL